MSIRIAEGRNERTASIPDTPSKATWTSYPSSLRIIAMLWTAVVLSSTTRTRRGGVDIDPAVRSPEPAIGSGATIVLRTPLRARTGTSGRASGSALVLAAVRTGSRTMNSLPRSGPSLRACTEPPCISVRLRTRFSPSPSPP